jgi:hypothetical protein
VVYGLALCGREPEFGFCGMVPVLPYQLRGDNVGQNYNPKMVL